MYELCNLKFEESFYKGEEIDGFWVTGLMKRAWASQLEVLYIIDRICKKHNLNWYADWGTLLGTIRHKGFIPWDDDVDICMKRKEYDLLMKFLPQELPEEYMILRPSEKDIHNNTMLRVINSSGVNFDHSFLQRYHGCPYVCGIDIFPLDIVPEDPTEWELLQKIIMIILNTDALRKADKFDEEEEEERLRQIEDICGVSINRDGDVHQQLILLVDALACSYSDDNSGYMINMWQYALGEGKGLLRCEWYDEKEYLPFENYDMPVPKHYHEVLNALFGEDYMTPIRGTAMHEYPFYRKQKEDIHKDRFNLKGYEKREEWVARQMGLDTTEVFEYRLDKEEEQSNTYIYFCQSQVISVTIPHNVD